MPNGETEAVRVYVECFRMTHAEVRDLEKTFRRHPGIEGLGTVARKASGAYELGEVFVVYVAPFLAAYAGNRVLDFVVDETKEWFKNRGSKSGFITLGLNGKRKQVGSGRPKRLR